jgi:hypothetical protein
MAYILDDEDKKNQPGAQGGNEVGEAAGGVFAGGGFGGAPGGQPGTGGQPKSWTNIQEYLKANEGASKSDELLSNKVGSQFQNESARLSSSAQEAKDKAKETVEKNTIATDRASQMIADMGSQYQYGGAPQSDAYTQNRSQFQNALSYQYNPEQFAYGMDGKTQEYGQGLNEQNFRGLMDNLYAGQSATGRMGAGQKSLQRQLDQENPALNQARQSLLAQYAGLEGDVGSAVDDVNQFQQGKKSEFDEAQSGLRGHLTNQGQTEMSALDLARRRTQGDLDDYLKYYETQPNRLKVGDVFNGQPSDIGDVMKVNSYQYGGPRTVSLENVTGVDQERARYNALMDVLGLQGQAINQGTPFEFGDMLQSTSYEQEGDNFGPSSLMPEYDYRDLAGSWIEGANVGNYWRPENQYITYEDYLRNRAGVPPGGGGGGIGGVFM